MDSQPIRVYSKKKNKYILVVLSPLAAIIDISQGTGAGTRMLV